MQMHINQSNCKIEQFLGPNQNQYSDHVIVVNKPIYVNFM
ncbi:43508_t:CDS:2 [Gigaspora margarita]|uniref:43508_t:CDS:1 n=1 Tax=Gigaspora margarita TaxID=4874 RepID=A0ABM8W4I0_GIGMA|nr:43508_t:CDS:2 [Gigaspora margarita]